MYCFELTRLGIVSCIRQAPSRKEISSLMVQKKRLWRLENKQGWWWWWGKHPGNSNGEKPLNLQRLPKLRVESGHRGGGPQGTVALRQSGREGGGSLTSPSSVFGSCSLLEPPWGPGVDLCRLILPGQEQSRGGLGVWWSKWRVNVENK